VHIIGIVAMGLILTAAASGPSYGRLVTSAQTVHRYFRQTPDSLNPVQRLVFSLLMANQRPTPPAHRS